MRGAVEVCYEGNPEGWIFRESPGENQRERAGREPRQPQKYSAEHGPRQRVHQITEFGKRDAHGVGLPGIGLRRQGDGRGLQRICEGGRQRGRNGHRRRLEDRKRHLRWRRWGRACGGGTRPRRRRDNPDRGFGLSLLGVDALECSRVARKHRNNGVRRRRPHDRNGLRNGRA